MGDWMGNEAACYFMLSMLWRDVVSIIELEGICCDRGS